MCAVCSDGFENSLGGKAEAVFYAGDYDKAITIWDSFLAIEPEYAVAWVGKGVALGNLGRFEEALAACDKALEIDPDFQQALLLKKQIVSNN